MTMQEPQTLAEMQAAHKARRARMYAAGIPVPKPVKIAPHVKPVAANTEPSKPLVTPLEIRQAVVIRCKISMAMFLGKRQFRVAVMPRQIFTYLCHKHTDVGWAGAARHTRQDSSTSQYAGAKIAAMVASGNDKVIEIIRDVERELGLA